MKGAAGVLFVFATIIGLSTVCIFCNGRKRESYEQSEEEPEFIKYAQELYDGLDKSVNPCEDFYQYACGRWISKQDLNDEDMLRSLFVTQEKIVRDNIRKILETSKSDNGSALRKAQDMYDHCLHLKEDEGIDSILNSMEATGGWPLLEPREWDHTHKDFEKIDNLLTLLAQIRRQGQSGLLFSVKVGPDLKNNSNQIITFSQPSLSELYNANYFTEENKKRKIANIIKLAKKLKPSVDEVNAVKNAYDIFNLNNYILHFLTIIDEGDLNKYYMKMTIEKFISLTQINWLHFLNVLFDSVKLIELHDEIFILTIDYFLHLSRLLLRQRFTPRTIINFEITKEIAFQYKLTTEDSSPKPHSNILSLSPHCLPSPEQPRPPPFSQSPELLHPRSTMCLVLVETCFDNALVWKYGELFLNRKEDIKEAKAMARNIFSVFSTRLNQLDWLDDSSRKRAWDKLSSMSDLYLYPQWDSNQQLINRFYKEFDVSDNFIDDIIAFQKFLTEKRLQKILHSYRHFNGWSLSPLRVDAVYLAEENAIHILAGIMQAPIYSSDRLRVMNYGALGTIIGHEIIHGFDLIGIQFDKNGNLNKWITPESRKKYIKKKQCFVDQYSKYRLSSTDLPGSDGYQINGVDTLNENIADNAGLRYAFWAYKKWSKENEPEILPIILDEFTLDQVFFLSFAHTWCVKYGNSTDWENFLGRDTHSPPKYRIIGAVSNFNEFSQAFGCNFKNSMNGEDKICELW